MAFQIAFLFLLLATFTTGTSAATFTITNNCPFTVWPAAIPVGGGTQLAHGQTWTLNVPAGTSAARIWPRTGCSFNGGGGGGGRRCATGDCAGALSCRVSGQPPATLAEFTLGGATDFYDISVIDGFNVAMDFACSTGDALRCRDAGCPDAYHSPARPTPAAATATTGSSSARDPTRSV